MFHVLKPNFVAEAEPCVGAFRQHSDRWVPELPAVRATNLEKTRGSRPEEAIGWRDPRGTHLMGWPFYPYFPLENRNDLEICLNIFDVGAGSTVYPPRLFSIHFSQASMTVSISPLFSRNLQQFPLTDSLAFDYLGDISDISLMRTCS